MWGITKNNRVVELTKHLGGGRYLCTDNENECHPCYNTSDFIYINTEAKVGNSE